MPVSRPPHPPEFWEQIIALVRARRTPEELAVPHPVSWTRRRPKSGRLPGKFQADFGWGPQSLRRPRPRAIRGANPPMWARTP
jgi:hypothetical protein